MMFTAISFSWSLLLAWCLHSVVFIHVVFVWWCSLLSLSLGHYCWHDIYTQLCSSMSCLFDDVHCYLFLLVIIAGMMSTLSCVHPCRVCLMMFTAISFSWSLLLTWYLHSVVFIHVVFVWWCSLLSLSLGHYCWQYVCIELCPAMKNQQKTSSCYKWNQ